MTPTTLTSDNDVRQRAGLPTDHLGFAARLHRPAGRCRAVRHPTGRLGLRFMANFTNRMRNRLRPSSAPPLLANPPPRVSNRPDFHGDYLRHVGDLVRGSDSVEAAMHAAIGGEFQAMGLIERDLLISQGLRPDGFVVDVGCGSGRLAAPLAGYLTGRYLGTEVVPDLLEHARRLVPRPDWRFELPSEPLTIPAESASADIVCFFSVFTHLLHEESYRYLEEAQRVLKPTGRIVFSFLEFRIPSHWAVFRSNLADLGTAAHLNQFIERNAIEVWAQHLGMRVLELSDGDTPTIPLSQPVTLEGGQHYEELGALGQSIAVLGY